MHADRGVDTSHVEVIKGRPTRDILVTRSLEGDRTFAGFGKARTEEYADCFLDPGKVNWDVVKVRRERGGGRNVCGPGGLFLGGTEALGGGQGIQILDDALPGVRGAHTACCLPWAYLDLMLA
jgi:hypothetical protein